MSQGQAMNSQLPVSPFQWLADGRFAVWLTRLFWLLLILETYLWTTVGQLFRHGEIIAPVLFATSKAAMLVLAAFLLSHLPQGKGAGKLPRRQAVNAISSALFLLWFAETFLHVLSVLCIKLLNGVLAQLESPGTNSWDVLDMLLRESGLYWFETATAGYLFLTNLAYGAIAVLLLRWMAKRWPARASADDETLGALPHWLILIAGYAAVAVAHALLVRVQIS